MSHSLYNFSVCKSVLIIERYKGSVLLNHSLALSGLFVFTNSIVRVFNNFLFMEMSTVFIFVNQLQSVVVGGHEGKNRECPFFYTIEKLEKQSLQALYSLLG